MIFLAALAFQIATSLAFALLTGFPNSFDELQHVSLIRWEALHAALFPAYEHVPTVTPDLSGWTPQPNYLNHPAPYYLALAQLPDAGWQALRLVNVMIAAVAVAIMLATGFRVVRQTRSRLVFAAALVLFPKLGLISGIVNNDNMALLASAIFFAALVFWSEGRAPWLMALALAACGWTKLTVFVMAVFALGMLEILRTARISCPHAVAGAGVAVGAIPTFVNLARYHAPLWRPDVFWLPPARRAHLDLGDYAGLFFRQLVDRWPAADGFNPAAAVALVLVLAAAAWIVWRRPEGWLSPAAMGLALLPTLALHLWFGWQAFQADGYLDSAQSRYYYALWPGFALALAMACDGLPSRLRGPAAAFGGVIFVTISTPAFLALRLLVGGSLHSL